jgi:hypothetical protein
LLIRLHDAPNDDIAFREESIALKRMIRNIYLVYCGKILELLSCLVGYCIVNLYGLTRKFKSHFLLYWVLQTGECKKRVCAFCETRISDGISICYKCLENYEVTLRDLSEDDGCGCDR